MDYWNWVRERILFERILTEEMKLWDLSDKAWDDEHLDQ